jgi:hypothetical protein
MDLLRMSIEMFELRKARLNAEWKLMRSTNGSVRLNSKLDKKLLNMRLTGLRLVAESEQPHG